jgi:hypothetical protein
MPDECASDDAGEQAYSHEGFSWKKSVGRRRKQIACLEMTRAGTDLVHTAPARKAALASCPPTQVGPRAPRATPAGDARTPPVFETGK